MSNIEQWSKTAAANNTPPPDGWPENMTRPQVNNSAREMMASLRTWYDDPQWLNLVYGFTVSKLSDTLVKIAAVDATAYFIAGRRVRLEDGSTIVKGFVVSSLLNGADTEVTVELGTDVVQVGINLILAFHSTEIPSSSFEADDIIRIQEFT